MLIQVKLLQYGSKQFTYSVPINLQAQIAPGVLVQVPLKKKIVPALVASIDSFEKTYPFIIKPICSVYPFPSDVSYANFIQFLCQYYQVDSLIFLKRIEQFLSEKEQDLQDVIPLLPVQTQHDVQLTDEQQQVLQVIQPSVINKNHAVFLLHGVTGSGKTEIYKRLIQDVLSLGHSAVVMLPEVCLALRFANLFAAHFCTTPVIGFHSASSVSQK